MKNSSGGYVFVMTLLLVCVISLLLLTSLQHLLLSYNGFKQLEKSHQRFYQLEAVAKNIAQSTSLMRLCLLQEEGANRIIRRLVSHEGCPISIEERHYLYFIEELGDFPCLLSLQNNKPMSTRHRRISVLSLGENRPDSLVQLRLITPIQVQECEGEKQTISLGVSSWRYLSYVQ